MRRRNAAVAATLAVLLTAGVGACGDDGGGGGGASGDGGDSAGSGAEHSRDDYVALLAGGGEGMSDQQAQCISEAVVDTIGVDALEEAGVWDDLQADPEGALADYGVVVGEQQVSAISAGIGACIDVREFFEEMTVADGGSPALAACLSAGIDDTTLQRLIAVSIVAGEPGMDAEAELVSAIETAARSCSEQGIS
jgi:hypothetical protein